MLRHTARLLTMLTACIVALAGCGGGEGGTTGDGDGSQASGDVAASITHVEGAAQLEGDALTVTPESGEPVVLALGPEVAANQLQAYSVSGEPVRAYYREGEDPLTASRVELVPKVDEGAESVVGLVAQVSPGKLVVTGDDGTAYDFVVRPEDEPAFDVAHLEEHQAEEAKVKVYYVEEGETLAALSYEDA